MFQQLLQYDFDLDIEYHVLSQQIVDRLHSAGRKVNVWTVDDPAVAGTLISWGVDHITSNILEYIS